jgi:hypothetical protein
MKKFFPYILTLGILGLVFIPTHLVHAGGIVSLATGGFAVGSYAIEQIALYFFHAVFVAILTVMSWVLWLSGQILNYVLMYTIIGMKTNLANLTGINIAWKLLRDLMNIAFIFMLVYEGILLIIQQGSTNNIKKFITGIVLASLLINFSLFFTKVLIDASNIVTIGFYNNILGNKAASENEGLSNPIVKYLGLNTIYHKDGDPSFGEGDGLPGIFIMGLGSGIVILVAAFIFFAVAILFTIRYVVLLVLLMLSPIAYMGMALPFMSGYAKDWWNTFKNQLLFPPIFMIMMWVIIILIKSPGFIKGSDSSFADLFSGSNKTGTGSNINLVFNFVVIIGLMITALITAKKTATQGSKVIGDATNKLSAYAGGVVAGGTARFSRNTVGRAGSAISNSEYLKDKEVNGNLVTRNLARYTRGSGTRAATSSFDVRATDQFKGLSKNSGFDFGKAPDPKKVNFQKDLENKAKKEADYAKTLKPTDDALRDREITQKALEKEQAKAKATFDNSSQKIKNMKDRTERLKENVNKAKTFEEREKIKNEIVSLEEQTKTEQLGLDALRKANEATTKAAKDYKDKTENIFTQRVEAYANSFENEKWSTLYAKNLAKVFGGAGLGLVSGVGSTVGGLGGASYVTTRKDNRAIAREIRKATKTKKTAKELIEEALQETGERPEAEAATSPVTPPVAPVDNTPPSPPVT